MLTRSLVLKSMLVALAASALLGLAAIFLDSALANRILQTAVLIAVASALMIPAAARDASTRIDLYQRFHLGYIIIATLLLMMVIWSGGMGSNLLEGLIVTWFALGIPAYLVATPALFHRRRDDRALALAESIAIWGAFVVLLGTCAAWIFGSAIPSSSPMYSMNSAWNSYEHYNSIGFIMLAATVAAATSAVGWRAASTSRFNATPAPSALDRRLAPIGIGCAACAGILGGIAVITTRLDANSASEWWPATVLFGALATAIGVWNLLGLSRCASALRFLRHLASTSVLALGLILTYALWLDTTQWGIHSEFMGQLMLAFAVVASTSIIGALILMRIHRGRAFDADPITSIEWKCPRCSVQSAIALGESSCAGCGLAVLIDFRDDRCPGCGYNLSGMPASSMKCAECGRARQMPS